MADLQEDRDAVQEVVQGVLDPSEVSDDELIAAMVATYGEHESLQEQARNRMKHLASLIQYAFDHRPNITVVQMTARLQLSRQRIYQLRWGADKRAQKESTDAH